MRDNALRQLKPNYEPVGMNEIATEGTIWSSWDKIQSLK
jgi:hypothetical protein